MLRVRRADHWPSRRTLFHDGVPIVRRLGAIAGPTGGPGDSAHCRTVA